MKVEAQFVDDRVGLLAMVSVDAPLEVVENVGTARFEQIVAEIEMILREGLRLPGHVKAYRTQTAGPEAFTRLSGYRKMMEQAEADRIALHGPETIPEAATATPQEASQASTQATK